MSVLIPISVRLGQDVAFLLISKDITVKGVKENPKMANIIPCTLEEDNAFQMRDCGQVACISCPLLQFGKGGTSLLFQEKGLKFQHCFFPFIRLRTHPGSSSWSNTAPTWGHITN